MNLLGNKYGDDWALFVRYVVGECTEREAEQVRSAIAADESKAQLLDSLQYLWGRSRQSKLPVDKHAEWARLNLKIREEARIRYLPAAKNRPAVVARERRRHPSRLLAARPLLILAAVFVSAVVGAVFFGALSEETAIAELRDVQEVVTRNGQRAAVRLPDGTRVYVNGGSTFSAPEEFGADRREVHLEGEAFFEVAREVDRPFIVHTSHAAVEVLGTSFDVSVYPDNDRARFVVLEGRVSVRPTGVGREEAVILNARDLVEVYGEKPPLVQRGVDIDRFLAWREGRLVFRNSPFKEVAAQLERKYGVEVELIGAPETADGLSAVFQDEPVGEVIRSIATTLNLQYRLSGNKISFSASGEGV